MAQCRVAIRGGGALVLTIHRGRNGISETGYLALDRSVGLPAKRKKVALIAALGLQVRMRRELFFSLHPSACVGESKVDGVVIRTRHVTANPSRSCQPTMRLAGTASGPSQERARLGRRR
jgi:hypothetical protein